MRYLMIVLLVIACGQHETESNNNQKIPFQNAVIIDSENEEIGYVIGLTNGYANIYHLELGLYMHVNLKTGAHKKRPSVNTEVILFESKDCSGIAYLQEWQGEVGATIIKLVNEKMYAVSDIAPLVNYNSILYHTGVCTTSKGTIPIEVAVLTEYSGRVSLDNLPYTMEYESIEKSEKNKK